MLISIDGSVVMIEDACSTVELPDGKRKIASYKVPI
jgi:hypothetical protein